MNHAKQLGIFVKAPVVGAVKTRLSETIGAEAACDLYRAFLRDLFRRLGRVKGARVTVFHHGGAPEAIAPLLPRAWPLEPQEGEDLGARLSAASTRLLARGGRAVIIGSDSPDLPVQYIRRAFQRLKHKDVVLGPASDGGYYLVGLRAPAPALFEGISWSGPEVLAGTLERIEREGLSLHLLPMWYDVDDAHSLRLFQTLLAARRLEGRDRLSACEAVLNRIQHSE
jgi:rSAM/selenodomain-associated transferase 1